MNAKFYELHSLIAKIVEDDSWACLGLRATRNESESIVGEYLDDSYIWVDGVCTDDQLNGVCALGIDADNYSEQDLVDLIKMHGSEWCDFFGIESSNAKYGYDGINLILVQGDESIRGEDTGEYIISNAKTIWTAN